MRHGPLYKQVIHALIRDIESGRLAPRHLPPEYARLDASAGDDRKANVLAYEDLVAQGWPTTAVRLGHTVRLRTPDGGLAF